MSSSVGRMLGMISASSLCPATTVRSPSSGSHAGAFGWMNEKVSEGNTGSDEKRCCEEEAVQLAELMALLFSKSQKPLKRLPGNGPSSQLLLLWSPFALCV